MVEVWWDRILPVYDVQVSIDELIRNGSTMFRMRVPARSAPALGDRIAAVDPEGWRVEVLVVEATPPEDDLVGLLLQPIAPEGRDPMAIKGHIVNGEWEPLG